MSRRNGAGAGRATFHVQDEPELAEYRDILIDHKWLIVAFIAMALSVAAVYVTFAAPVYRANLLVLIEDSAPDSKSFLNETSGLFELKTSASGEVQVLGSRMVLGAAAEEAGLHISAQPRYLPWVGRWLARRAVALSAPGFMGLGGYVTGTERIDVTRFEVPAWLEDSEPFIITARGAGHYTVRHELLDAPLEGAIGQPLRKTLADGAIDIQVDRLDGNPGAEFVVLVASRLRAVERLQERLQLGEQGRLSNVIGVALEDTDRVRLARVLNAIGEQYVRLNTERKSAEAEKTLAFLDAQLPIFERQLKASEDAFARFRNENGAIAFDEEAKVWLKRTADLQGSLLDLQQRRREAEVVFTDQSPRVLLLNRQIGAVQSDLHALNARIAGMPNVQRDALRLERDVRVNSSLYQSMQNNALQLRLLKEGKIGNVRLLDKAAVSKIPVKPKKLLVVSLALMLGMLVGPAFAVWRTRSRRGVRNPHEIEAWTGLDVYAVVPHGRQQALLDRGADKQGRPAMLLADAHPHSHPAEALRGLRVALKIAMAKAPNNRILITGATSGVGKSFVASNFAALLAQAGKRVLLIDADFRKGDTHDAFGLEREPGLSELLADRLDARQAIRAHVRPGLDVLTNGALPRLPVDLLESQAFGHVLDTLSARYDHVLIDTAPVLVAADATAVAPACGVVLLVARAEQSRLGELTESVRRLGRAGVVPHGVLLNGVDLRRRYSGSHGHRHGGYRHAEHGEAASR